MNKELQNRERRLRYKAKKKGLYIRKENYQINNETYSGYLVIKETGVVIACYSHPWKNLVTLDEAETIISEY